MKQNRRVVKFFECVQKLTVKHLIAFIIQSQEKRAIFTTCHCHLFFFLSDFDFFFIKSSRTIYLSQNLVMFVGLVVVKSLNHSERIKEMFVNFKDSSCSPIASPAYVFC